MFLTVKFCFKQITFMGIIYLTLHISLIRLYFSFEFLLLLLVNKYFGVETRFFFEFILRISLDTPYIILPEMLDLNKICLNQSLS